MADAPIDLTTVSDQDLQAEVQRRDKTALQEELASIQARMVVFQARIDQINIELAAP